ncbi:AraC-like DNA-binding protein [Limimaricola variabilis]|uniref:AraC-like DNA-binding protein n=1 Tax=Limimaricola variabilis TaxID=1492771 RepID=A0ABR6HSP0_9RHOB|nr:AraC family transcriptional regulator [Limimaricola variabilis]MBB3713572.1 AraC-like DNA-binding protein [Limimaricola variabilis]
MDDIEGGVLARIPPGALSLKLTRAAIRMQHSASWRIDKSNPVEDLVICLEGQGRYEIDGESLSLCPGEAMLIRRDERFIGANPDRDTYLGVAQHFTLTAYGGHDLIGQMDLTRKVHLSRWEAIGPMTWHYRQSAPPSSVTLQQHHLFMVLLIAFLEDAFLGWRAESGAGFDGAQAIDMAVMKAASRISAAPLQSDIVAAALSDAPYNPDYFHRAFRDRTGRTPQQYREFCRMERAMHLLETGHGVAATAAELGFADPYYFSRVFKRTLGLSPKAHLDCVRQSRDGRLLHLDEAEQRRVLAREA